MKRITQNSVFQAVAATLLASTLTGGVLFARTMDRKVLSLEDKAGVQSKAIDSLTLTTVNQKTKIDRIEKMVQFLATKAGYVPPELGSRDQ